MNGGCERLTKSKARIIPARFLGLIDENVENLSCQK
jgi:hypothetical protein